MKWKKAWIITPRERRGIWMLKIEIKFKSRALKEKKISIGKWLVGVGWCNEYQMVLFENSLNQHCWFKQEVEKQKTKFQKKTTRKIIQNRPKYK